jgi:ribosomal protein S18 acetylase RimI-like enzyme
MLIEIATLKDASQILDLQKLAYQSEAAIYDDYTIPPLIQSLAGMESDIQNQIVLKAVQDSKIIGSVRGSLQDGTGFIGRLIVQPAYQNRGLGTQLMQEIERHLSQAGRYELFTGHQSTRNLHLYQKLGYRILRSEPVNDRLTLVYLEKITAPGKS